MQRTAEKVLAIISLVFTILTLIGSFFLVSFIKLFNAEDALGEEVRMKLFNDPAFSDEEVELILSSMDALSSFSWIVVVVLVISIVATIVGMIYVWNNKNPKVAGMMFIIGGLFAFAISLMAILLYAAAILCFARKPPVNDVNDSYSENNYEDSMRPL